MKNCSFLLQKWFCLRRNIKHLTQCLITRWNTSKFVKNTPLRVLFSTLFSVFHLVLKHCISCLIYYIKFLKDVYFSTEYMHSEFQLLACAFWFFITFCSRCGMNWDRACRPTDDPFWAFLSPGAQEPVHPQTLFVYFGQLKNIYIGHASKRHNDPGLLPQQGFWILLYKFETSWALLGRPSRGFFCHLRGL